jgi:hypothetical protein
VKTLNMAGGGIYRASAAKKMKKRDVYRASNEPRRKGQMAKKGPTF